MVDYGQDIRNCLNILHSGGTILYPTDTIWGIGGDALNEIAIGKIYQLKQRPKEKSMIILLADSKDITTYVQDCPLEIVHILDKFDMPTTVIYEKAKNLPKYLINEDQSIGIRVTKDPFCKLLISEFGGPIVSTSANISGSPSPALFNQIDSMIIKGVDYIVKYRQNDTKIANPSKIVKISKNGVLSIIRP